MKRAQKQVSRFGLTIMVIALLVWMSACGSGGTSTSIGNQTSSPSSSQPVNSTPASSGGGGGQGGGQEEAKSKYEDYYKGKTLTIIVGYAPGGGTDTETRILAKYLPKYLPGSPSIAIRNLPGGGGITAGNVMYQEAKPDGMTLATPGRTSWISSAIMGEPSVQYKLDEFEWLGATGSGDVVIVTTDQSGIRSFEDLKAAPADSVIFGAWTRAAVPYVGPYLLSQNHAPSIRVVTGYGGAGDVLLAMERNEIQGAMIAHSAIHENDLKEGKYHIIATSGGISIPGTTRVEDIMTEEEMAVINLSAAPGLGVPFIAPPGTDPELVEILREAYAKTLADPDFLADNKAQSILVNHMSGEDVTALIHKMLQTTPDIVDKLQEIITE